MPEMSDVVKIAIISAVPGTLSIIVSFLNNIIARRNERHALENKASLIQAKVSIEKLEQQTNGIKDALLDKTEKEAYSRGVQAEKIHGKEILDAIKATQPPPVVVVQPSVKAVIPPEKNNKEKE